MDDDEDEDEAEEDSEESAVLSILRKETDERFIVGGRWCDDGQCDGIMTVVAVACSSSVAVLGVGGLRLLLPSDVDVIIDGDAVRRRRMLLGMLLLLLLLLLLAAGVATRSRGSLEEALASFVVVNDERQCSFLWHDE